MSKKKNNSKVTRRAFLKTVGSGVLAIAGTTLFNLQAVHGEPAIKIGFLAPLETEFGASAKQGASFGAGFVNESFPQIELDVAQWEGIPNLGDAKIELAMADHKFDPDRGVKLIAKLKADGAVGVLGAFYSPVMAQASQMAEELNLPYLDATSIAPYLTRRGLKNYFRLPAHLLFGTQLFFKIVKRFGVEVKNFLLVTITLLQEDLKIMKKMAGKLGFNLEGMILQPWISREEMKKTAQKIKAKGPGAVIFDLPAELISIASQAIAEMPEKERSWVVLVDPYGLMKDRLTDLLDLETRRDIAWTLLNLLSLPIKPEVPGPAPAVDSRFENQTGNRLDADSNLAFTGVQTWAGILNQAGSTQPQDLVEAAGQFELASTQMTVPWRGVDFAKAAQFGDLNQNIMSYPAVARLDKEGNYKIAGGGGVSPLITALVINIKCHNNNCKKL